MNYFSKRVIALLGVTLCPAYLVLSAPASLPRPAPSLIDNPASSKIDSKANKPSFRSSPITNNDPIRFSIQVRQATINLEDEVELVITAELLDITPASMFFTESASSFRIKLVMPEGFRQTGGSYVDYVGATLSPTTRPSVSYTVRGRFASLSNTTAFRLLRGNAIANDQSQFVEKAILAVNPIGSRSVLPTSRQAEAMYVVTGETSQQPDTQTTAVVTQPVSATGANPLINLSIGQVKTGKAGSDASATITGSAPDFKLNLVIPKGEKGDSNAGARATAAAAPNIVVDGFTNQAIQTAINAAPATGARIILPPGEYTFTSNISIDNKSNIVLDGQGAAVLKTSAINAATMIWTFHTCNNIRLTGLHLVSQVAGNYGYGMVATNEQSKLDGYEIDHCSFTAPLADFNAISMSQYSEGSNQGETSRNIRIHHNKFFNIGRMGIEILSHGFDGVYRLDGIDIHDNEFRNLGINSTYGMSVSLSGLMQNARISNNQTVDAKEIGYEVVNARYVNIVNNVALGVNNTFAGIGISDNNRNLTQYITVSGNTCTTKGAPLQAFGTQWLTVTGNTFYNPTTANSAITMCRFSSCKYGSFTGNTVVVAANSALTLDNTGYYAVSGNNLSNALNTNGYELIYLYNTQATRNVIGTNVYIKAAGTENNGIPNVRQAAGAANNTY
ncbi:glycoside hydrolase family 55 protein [Spirosoma sp. RP8]|uniref:Glycoside hydrolase family 55 protein n=1 Tax=Spirosoma liriopis TaxID=2937440 RepID=A0ABT0HEG9_9BACT|nr:glycoside hydrolase family 55 protein [Spirosoma liriopis]MCK8490558.1 glycoside hydrolase family 55 protein [Spirosoma liriopis]